MKLFKRSVELVVIRDIFNPTNNIEQYKGRDIEQLLKQAFGEHGLSENVRLYHGNMLDEVTPKTPQDVDKIMRLNGRIYAVVKPMGLDPFSWAIIAISVAVSVAVAFLMPAPTMASVQGQNSPPSPNNALAARTNSQRLGGRIPDIFGTVWSVPDLIAPTYSVYIDHKEIEYSYMCIGRGRYSVTKALDDTTPVKHVGGSGVLIYDPDDNLNDAPSHVFGEQFDASQAEFARLAAKKYSSVNGQELPYPDAYRTRNAKFSAPNKVQPTVSFSGFYKVGSAVLIEGADNLQSGLGFDVDSGGVDNEGNPIMTPVTYSLSGSYEVESVTSTYITLKAPHLINSDWQKLIDNQDFVDGQGITFSKEETPLWQGWYYTEAKNHDKAFINLVALNGLYYTVPEGDHFPIGITCRAESELVDASDNPIAGTLHSQQFTVWSPAITRNNHRVDIVRSTAALTVEIDNPHYVKGTRMRIRVSRKTPQQGVGNRNSEVQDVKLESFYSCKTLQPEDMPKGVTTVYTKTLATEGALSLKERKLRLLVQRYVTDATSGLPKLSNRADDILRHIATDPKIGNLDISQVDIAQIKTEVDNIVTYFGTEKCSEFCGTFDDNNLSAEETMQIVARAVFSQAKRQGNKVMLDFECIVPASVAVFNSHNILPDTFTSPQSFGVHNDYDGVTVEYTDPVDDAVVTLSYPNDVLVNPHEEKLTGVRNKVQAHMHAMRILNRDLYVYKSCEFTAGDESNIVVRTNRITVADQLRADVQQGSIDSIEVIGGDIVLNTSEPVLLEPSGQYTAFIQTINNGVEAIEVTANNDYSVKLARLPSGEISNGYDAVVQAVYQIVSNDDKDRDAYLVTEKSPSEGMTNQLTCTNYDDRFYQNDSDYKDGLIA